MFCPVRNTSGCWNEGVKTFVEVQVEPGLDQRIRMRLGSLREELSRSLRVKVRMVGPYPVGREGKMPGADEG